MKQKSSSVNLKKVNLFFLNSNYATIARAFDQIELNSIEKTNEPFLNGKKNLSIDY